VKRKGNGKVGKKWENEWGGGKEGKKREGRGVVPYPKQKSGCATEH